MTSHIRRPFQVAAIRAEFPILQQKIEGKSLVYLDNAATTQKPFSVIQALTDFYTQYNANVHRGAHYLADHATARYEQARDTVAAFINARSRREVIWTSGTTASINLVAHGIAQRLEPGDEILVTEMEHHANLVTWQQACSRSGATLKIAPISDQGVIDEQAFVALLSDKTRLVALPHVSNALGTINPVQRLTQFAKAVGALVLIDGAQAIAHGGVDVTNIGCDFYAFSGHKLFGPTGVGVLWGNATVLEDWPVWQTGGEMIAEVSYQSATWNTLPHRFEAGTPNIGGVLGLAAAVEWLSQFDVADIQQHEQTLLDYATAKAQAFEGLQIIGTAPEKVGVLSFLLKDCHPTDLGLILNQHAIAIRTGTHCAQPLMQRLGITGTVRASFSLYNTLEDVDALFAALADAKHLLTDDDFRLEQ